LDPLDLWKLTPEEKASGMTFFHQIFNIQMRCAVLNPSFVPKRTSNHRFEI